MRGSSKNSSREDALPPSFQDMTSQHPNKTYNRASEAEMRNGVQVVECPICCMYYRVMNKTKCCGQRLCSECIVQIRIGCPYSGTSCPFCKKSGLDVEICEGKSDTEKQEDMLEEQRFTECRLRQLAEANSGSLPTSSENLHSQNVAPPPPDTNVSGDSHENREQMTLSTAPSTEPGDSSSSRYNPPTPRSVEDEYRQEYVALTHRATISNLSNSEMQQCEDYLGVCPEDLGLRLEEFNDLLLEQTLISSMIEMRKKEREATSDEEDTSQPAVAQDQGGSSNLEEEPTSPSLRSHSLPLPHPLAQEETTSPQGESSEAPRWSLENVLRQVSTASPFTFLSLNSGEPSSSAYTPAPPSPFSPECEPETPPPPQSDGPSLESNSSSGSQASPSDVWKNLLNSLAGFDDAHTQFRMVRVRFDDPQIDSFFNGRPATAETEEIEMTQRPTENPETPIVTEQYSYAKDNPIKTVAVENPDGSLSLVSVPCEETPEAEPATSETPSENPRHDIGVIRATEEADRSQVDAIEASDARLRELFNRRS